MLLLKSCCPIDILCNCSSYFSNNPWISPLILIDLYHCNFHFSFMMHTIQGFYVHIQSQEKMLQPLSYLLFFFTDRRTYIRFLRSTDFYLVDPIPDLSFGDLWLSKTLSRVMELFKNLIWVFAFSTFKTSASSL
jgi:hypothetical protein